MTKSSCETGLVAQSVPGLGAVVRQGRVLCSELHALGDQESCCDWTAQYLLTWKDVITVQSILCKEGAVSPVAQGAAIFGPVVCGQA